MRGVGTDLAEGWRKMLPEEDRAKLYDQMHGNSEDPRHGTTTGYRYGCRCERCTAARMAYQEEYRARKRARLRVKQC